MRRPVSTLRTLIPLSRPAVVQDTPYADALPDDSPYRVFAACLDDYDRNPQKHPTWGVYNPQEMLHDDGAIVMPRFEPERGAKLKIKPSVIDGFASYFTAMATFDTMVRLSASEDGHPDVLVHPHRTGWIGDSKLFAPLGDLPQLILDFQANCQSPGFAGDSCLDPPAANDHATRLANEIEAAGGAIGAYAAVRNVAVVAFNIAVMAKGFIHVPLNFQELDTPLSSSHATNFIRVMARARRLRQVLMVASTISPLVLLTGVDLLEVNICAEEVLLNFKRLGNERPAVIRRAEDDLWSAIFSVAEGHQTATNALRFIAQVWRTRKAHLSLAACESTFFDVDGDGVPYHPSMSLYSATPLRPFPPDWPLPAACAVEPEGIIDETLSDAPADDPLPEVVNMDVAPHALENVVNRRSERQANNPVAPDAYANAQGSKKISGNKGSSKARAITPEGMGHDDEDSSAGTPARRLRRKDNSAVILHSENEDSSSSEDEVELLDYEHLQKTDKSVRTFLGGELVVKLEDSPILLEQTAPSVLEPLDFDETPTVFADPSNRSFSFYDAEGGVYSVKPVFYSEADCNAWNAMFERAQACHVKKDDDDPALPAFLSKPEESLIRCMTFAHRQKMKAAEIQSAMQYQSLVTTGVPGVNGEFELAELETVSELHTNAEFQDQSISIHGDFSVRMKSASLQQVHRHTQGPPEKLKPLNGLNFPNHHVGVQPSPLATDERAVRRTGFDQACMTKIVGGDIVFGLVSTANAMSYVHEDAHGEATRVRMVTGMKLWGLFEPLNPLDVSSTEFWTNPELDVRKLDLRSWRVEFIMLRPGDELHMRPSTKHAVLTVKDSIVHGNYLLPTTCLGRTACGMVHTFFEARIATNASHPAFHGRINAICAYFYRCIVLGDRNPELDDGYMPDFKTPEGLKNFLLFACAIETQLALTRQAYVPTTNELFVQAMQSDGFSPSAALERFDLSAATHELRTQIVYSRGRMKHLLQHVLSRISIKDEDGMPQDPWDFLFTPVLAWFIYGLKDYYRRSSQIKDSMGGDEAAAFEDSTVDPAEVALPPEALFMRQLSFCAGRWPGVEDAVADLEYSGCDVSRFVVDWPSFTLEWHDNEGAHAPSEVMKSFPELFKLGCSDGDILYFSAHLRCTRPTKRKREEFHVEGTPKPTKDVPWLTTRELSRAPSVSKRSRSL